MKIEREFLSMNSCTYPAVSVEDSDLTKAMLNVKTSIRFTGNF